MSKSCLRHSLNNPFFHFILKIASRNIVATVFKIEQFMLFFLRKVLRTEQGAKKNSFQAASLGKL